MKRKRYAILPLILLVVLAACTGQIPVNHPPQPAATQPARPTLTPFQPLEPTSPAETASAARVEPAATGPAPVLLEPDPTPTRQPPTAPAPAASPVPTSTAAPDSPSGLQVWASPSLPDGFRSAVASLPGVVLAEQAEHTGLQFNVGAANPVAAWIYALAVPFPTTPDQVSFAALQGAWRGEPGGPFAGRPLLASANTAAVFTALWGAPAGGAVQVLPAEELAAAAWDQRPSWALLPFDDLEPRWKVLEIDGQSPLRKDFDPAAYPLVVPVSLSGYPDQIQEISALLPASNRDASKMTVLAMTGVTALVRATAFTMEREGILYPGRDIGAWLREADLTHISNEVPFARDCPYPNPVQPDMRFCSDARYIALLEDMGTDIVELTGDHFQDWGSEAMFYTLDLYKERGWPYYGGGANLEEGRRALMVEHNGNRLAFIGCNAKGGGYAQASANHPGAVVCDEAWMQAEIRRVRGEGYLPIATFQHFEYYTYQAQPNQKKDFRAMADAGAVIVSGSQAHQPQAFEFAGEALIHYGLGNLFFDQLDVSLATRQGFIDRHVFYDGRYIGTDLLTILFIDYARPRPMTIEERQDLLGTVFAASGW